MKIISLATFSILFLSSSLLGQSYWFGGMTRVPGGETDGLESSFNLGGQSFSQNVVSVTINNSPITLNDDQDTFLEYQTFQLGGELAWLTKFVELEGGMDLSFSGAYTDHPAFDDEFFLGINLRLGGVLKYDFQPSENVTITPFLRSGISLEFVTNDLAPATLNSYNPYSYDYAQGYDDFYGTSLMNIFYNFRLGSSLRWNGLTTAISLGKYFPIGGDISDFYDSPYHPYNAPEPVFLQLNVGYEFSDSFAMTLGWRLEWWDEDVSYSDTLGNIYKEKVEWDGSSVDLTFDKKF
jgi:hypothetical protein